MSFLTELEQTIQNFIWNDKRHRIAKPTLSKQMGGITLPDFRQHYKATAIKSVWYWYNNGHAGQWNRIENPQINPDSYLH